jgi:hypothetical protein
MNFLFISDSFILISVNRFGQLCINIENNLYSFLLKFIRGIEISIILLLDEGSSDSLNRDNIISYSSNSFKIII